MRGEAKFSEDAHIDISYRDSVVDFSASLPKKPICEMEERINNDIDNNDKEATFSTELDNMADNYYSIWSPTP